MSTKLELMLKAKEIFLSRTLSDFVCVCIDCANDFTPTSHAAASHLERRIKRYLDGEETVYNFLYRDRGIWPSPDDPGIQEEMYNFRVKMIDDIIKELEHEHIQ